MVSSAGLTLLAMANVLRNISLLRNKLNTSSLGCLVQLMVTVPAETTCLSGIMSWRPATKGMRRARVLSLKNMTFKKELTD